MLAIVLIFKIFFVQCLFKGSKAYAVSSHNWNSLLSIICKMNVRVRRCSSRGCGCRVSSHPGLLTTHATDRCVFSLPMPAWESPPWAEWPKFTVHPEWAAVVDTKLTWLHLTWEGFVVKTLETRSSYSQTGGRRSSAFISVFSPPPLVLVLKELPEFCVCSLL